MSFSNQLITWYLQNKRDLPWRRSKDPYRIWLSEVILQQTRIVQGTGYYHRFIEKFPTVFDLAKATEADVLKIWQGLGYYTRARNLHFTARQLVNENQGVFPKTYNKLIRLKGIGKYTAGAIASICFDLPYTAVDGNAYRVMSRYFNIHTPINSAKGIKEFDELAGSLIPKTDPGNYNQAVMELGALICTPKNPKCESCPLKNSCISYRSDRIDLLPVREKKLRIRKRYFNFLVFDINAEFTVLQQRKNKDIWQNLYQFPLLETQKGISYDQILTSEIFKESGITNFQISRFNRNPVIHKLTHQTIITDFWIIKSQSPLKNMTKWKNVPNFAVPILIHNFIETYRKDLEI